MSLKDEGIEVEWQNDHVFIYDDNNGTTTVLTVDEAEELAHHIRWAVATIRYNEPGAEG